MDVVIPWVVWCVGLDILNTGVCTLNIQAPELQEISNEVINFTDEIQWNFVIMS